MYGSNGIDEAVLECARDCREAMDEERAKRGGGMKYNVFIVSGRCSANFLSVIAC